MGRILLSTTDSHFRMKVIYISYVPLSQKIKEDFYFDVLRENSIEVAFWDLTCLYFPEQYDINKNPDPLVTRINTFSGLNKAITQENKSDSPVYISLITYTGLVIRLFRILTKNNCKLLFFARGMLPMPSWSLSTRINALFSSGKIFREIYQALLHGIAGIYKRTGWVKPYDTIFTAGSEGYRTLWIGNKMDRKYGLQIQLNSFDYDKFLAVKDVLPLINEPYIVFLDEYLPFHPDFLILNKKTINPGEYFLELNNFFDRLERQMNMKIVIAAHPKAELYRTEDHFKGRPVIFDKTCELVKHSEFAIAHMSTAISFPVLSRKPIVFLSTIGIKKDMLSHHLIIENFAKVLNAGMVLYDDLNTSPIKVTTVDAGAYNEYIYKYLTSPISEKQFSKDIFLTFLKNLESKNQFN